MSELYFFFPNQVNDKSNYTYLQLSLSRLTCYQTFNVCLLWKIESKSPLHEYRATSLTLLTGKITNSHPSAEEKSYINVTEAKEKACRSLSLNLWSGI